MEQQRLSQSWNGHQQEEGEGEGVLRNVAAASVPMRSELEVELKRLVTAVRWNR